MKGYQITDQCVLCGACVPVCPERCVLEGECIYVIKTEECTECDECLPVCPVDAIVPAPRLGFSPAG